MKDHRFYMELAIEEMMNSEDEPRADGKPNPKVGAVLVFPDGEYITAHRGELRNGNHAEYVLIERKCVNRDLSEAVLYSTLEPCVKRNPPKRGCCRHVSSARIKTVYVGIEDPDPTVAGDGIRYIEENGGTVKMFDRELQERIEQANTKFLEKAHERARIAKKETKEPKLKKVVPNYDLGKLSDVALQHFITEANLEYDPNSADFHDYLADVGVLELDQKAQVYRPTMVGVLLFGKNPRSKYKQAVLKAHVDYGDHEIEPQDFEEPLVLVPDAVEKWLKKALPLSMDTSSFKRKDVPAFPIDVLREAVVNAIVHRDYEMEEAKCHLEIDNDKIIVKSPGAPLPAISLEQLNTFRAPSLSRNPIITFIFSKMDYMEEKGFGMKLLRSLNETHGLPLPTYVFTKPHLSLIFPRSLESVPLVSGLPGLSLLTEDELKGYEFVKQQRTVKRREYEGHFGLNAKTAERHLTKMVEAKLIERKGAGPSTYYEIIAT